MRPKTFILLILVLVVGAVAVVLFVLNQSDGGLGGGDDNGGVSNIFGNTDSDTNEDGADTVEATPIPPTPAIQLVDVVVARADLPVGVRISEDLVEIEQRPNVNIALQGGYHFTETEQIIGKIVRVDVQRGDAVLAPMLAVEARDLTTFGSDLSLFVDRGNVAVAFPANERTSAAFAMRPGDFVDVMMTAQIIEIDPEFRSILPNVTERVRESDLLEGVFFFFPQLPQGRLEFIEEINQVVEIIPNNVSYADGNPGFEDIQVIPKRVTQLTIQKAEVLWVGTWQDTVQLEQAHHAAMAAALADPENLQPTPTPLPQRPENEFVDVIILSMPAQEAVALKYALERNMQIDLALRGQGDQQDFSTSSVSLFQIVEQGGLIVPPPVDYDLQQEGVIYPWLFPEPFERDQIEEDDGSDS